MWRRTPGLYRAESVPTGSSNLFIVAAARSSIFPPGSEEVFLELLPVRGPFSSSFLLLWIMDPNYGFIGDGFN